MESEMNYVDAIDEGRIVRVTESYAKREGLPILRKPKLSEFDTQKKKDQFNSGIRSTNRLADLDKYRRPLRMNSNEILSSLHDNFHWQIIKKRKQNNLTRRQLAQVLNIPEDDLRVLETGVLPRNDYVLVSKVAEYLGLNLRKDGQNFASPRAVLESLPARKEPMREERKPRTQTSETRTTQNTVAKQESEDIDLFGDEIEIVDE